MAELGRAGSSRATLADRWRELRNRLLASPRFQALAAAFPMTRPIARARARELFDLGAGFIYAQVYAAVMELGLLEQLAQSPLSSEEIAAACDLPAHGADRLARAAAAIGILEATSSGAWTLGERGAAALGTPGLARMIAHHRLLYRDLADPVGFFRSSPGRGDLAGYWAYAGAEAPSEAVSADRAAPYSDLMAATQPMVAAQVLDAYPLAGHRRLLDIAGGAGAFAAAALARHPHLHATTFDLPAVADRARARFAAEGFGARAEAIGGDLFADPLPQGADVLSLVRVLHDHDDAAAAAILRAARAACPPGGTLLIAEPMADTPGARAVGDAYFGVYLFAMGQGRARRAAEICAAARAAGFARIVERPTRIPLIARLLVAQA